MLSIEEAYEAAMSWANYSGDFLSEEGEAVLRALAESVLDVTHGGDSTYHEALQGCNCTTWAEGDRCRAYKALRARIKALGR